MNWNEPSVRYKLASLLAIRYTDDFAHLGIGNEDDSIPEWEDYLKGLGVGMSVADFHMEEWSDGRHVAVEDPFFMNVYRIVPVELAEKVVVLGAFPQ